MFLKVVVPQGKEPPCFLQLFSGAMVIHKGKRDECPSAGILRLNVHELLCVFFFFLSTIQTNISNGLSAAEWRLFCVRGELPDEGSLLEVDCCCAGLRSRGCVVLLNSQQAVLYLWTGCKAHKSDREVGKRIVERLTKTYASNSGLSGAAALRGLALLNSWFPSGVPQSWASAAAAAA